MKRQVPDEMSIESYNELKENITDKNELRDFEICYRPKNDAKGSLTNYTLNGNGINQNKLYRILSYNGYYNKKVNIDDENWEPTISFLSTLLQNAEEKIKHFDVLRQNYINYALIIFAAPFTLLGFNFAIKKTLGFIFIAISIIMTIFCFLDNRLHRMSHGWQASRRIFIDTIIQVLDAKTVFISFPIYKAKGESDAELTSFQPVIYYSLIFCSIVCCILFLMFKFF